jgi:hypothetical protein
MPGKFSRNYDFIRAHSGLISVFLLALYPLAAAEPRADAWREDLRALLDAVSAKGTTVNFKVGIASRGQKDFEKLYPTFAQDIETLARDVPNLPDREVVLRLMQLWAAPNVAHNRVQLPAAYGFNERLPVTFTWFSDGLAVTGATPEYQMAMATRVLKIGSKSPEELVDAVAPYLAHENDSWLRQEAAGLLRLRAILEHLGVTDAGGQVAVTVSKPDGAPFTVNLKPSASAPAIQPAGVLRLMAPFTRAHVRERYWFDFLEDTGTLFIQYNACVNDPADPFPAFAAKVLARADAGGVQRVMIDLRRNGGGDSRIIAPLKSGLAARRNKLGKFYVLIGPSTFSSAVDNAIELQRSLGAVLVGEPSGGKPSSYGEVKQVELPNSKLVVRYTSKWFGSHSDSQPGNLIPAIVAPRTLADLVAERDPAFTAALAAGR